MKIVYVCAILVACFVIWQAPRLRNEILCEKKIPPPVAERYVINAVKHRPANVTSPTQTQKIPKIIVQTNEKTKVPENMAKSMNEIINSNPEYEYFYFDDEDARLYLRNNFPQNVLAAYDKVKPGAYKADLFRYCYLYKNGGVYMDTGFVPTSSLKDLITPNDEFISPEDDNTGGIFNAFICCTPRHPIIREAMLKSIDNIERSLYRRHPLDITGPAVLGTAFEKIVKAKPLADKFYGHGIRLITYKRTEACTSAGEISYNGRKLLSTKYEGYYIDRIWYNTNEHYSEMWHSKRVY